ncbi:hypothetical protein [Amycolatopsis sp. PS_44_ISF1]|uniref:sunset domain-containing protein n=1 Tax=Amycolatopsis sp. PS_44_ISF1 TaxID=2974917 RepID=UPI0028DF3D95|nr:hypothetical protein [Amycolatopsis sp. PS_44_ISF1]MDT8909855.1 hypothetical protein [Amycolatopsis sp. PS_44_ISF1]
MSIFGQVWLWSLLAFFVGVLLTWLVLVLPARKRTRELEQALTAAHAESARTPANAGSLGGGTALLSPVDEDEFSAPEPPAAPSWDREQSPTELIQRAEPEPREPAAVENRLGGFEPEAEYEAEYRTAAEPVAPEPVARETTVEADLPQERDRERESEPATRQIDPDSVYRAAATEYLSPVSDQPDPGQAEAGAHQPDRFEDFEDSGRGSFQEVGLRAGDAGHHEADRREDTEDREEDAFADFDSGRHAEAGHDLHPEAEPSRHAAAEPETGGSHHAAETTSLFTRIEPEPEDSFSNRLEPEEDPSFGRFGGETGSGRPEPEAEAGSAFGRLEPESDVDFSSAPGSGSDFGRSPEPGSSFGRLEPETEAEPVSLFQPAKPADPRSEPAWFERSASGADRSPFEEPAGDGFLGQSSSPEPVNPSPGPPESESAGPFDGDLVAGDGPIDSTQVLPKRQPREAPRGGFEPPRPIQPSMRPVERREPELTGTQSGSLFEPSVPPNPGVAAPLNAPEPPPARQVTGDAVPPGPFGPGSAMPRPGGGRPSDNFAVKASVTALRYCTEESPQFPRMVAEVWFRTASDAERVGFRPLS